MIEELQRSLLFFSKANAVLRNEHQELTRIFLGAKAELAKQGISLPEATKSTAPPTTVLAPAAHSGPASVPVSMVSRPNVANSLLGTPSQIDLPSMEPGATMQAMANFQQAAAVAMQSVAHVMKSSPVASEPQRSA
jgi:hypothetical protein